MMEPVRLAARRLGERVDALAVRERALIFVGTLVVLVAVTNSLLFGPLLAEQRRLERTVNERRTQVQALQTQVRTLSDSLARDPDAENRATLEALRTRIQATDEQLSRLVAGFVTPREMAKLIEQALVRDRGLEVMKVESLPPTAMIEEPKGEAPPEHMVYKHGVRIEMKGRYLDIVQYLRALEALPWKVFWGEIKLDSDKYPMSHVSVVIYTLSRHRGWIGT